MTQFKVSNTYYLVEYGGVKAVIEVGPKPINNHYEVHVVKEIKGKWIWRGIKPHQLQIYGKPISKAAFKVLYSGRGFKDGS
jgi:hypothetical protein